MEINKLDELYSLYKFQILPIKSDSVRVYSFINKYFSNADIILLKKISPQVLSGIIKEIEDLGFSTTIRNYKTIHEAEESLFDGFFDIERSNKLLKKNYLEYTHKIEKVIFGSYEYIKTECYDVENDYTLKDDIVSTIIEKLNESGPVLVLLEAAAGFGKTSTAYEILKYYADNSTLKKIPLFTELSRNRQASIFKYVMYDEINSKFTGLSLELVMKHIIEGRIPVVIDGFDELLKPKGVERTEDKFEDAEPMLETIKELLKGDAKILLTTRRTAIFSDDDFFKWLDENDDEFKFFRYNIPDPIISDWISVTREKSLQRAGLNIKSISNPVLLSYLKSMDDNQFNCCLKDIDKIIEDYIKRLMNRENERQDLKMTIDEQIKILNLISNHLTNLDVTSESKELLEKVILEKEHKLLYEVLDRFSPSKRPSVDQLINKLIIHAFLDRKGETGHQICFVNEFILGCFVGNNLINQKSNWIGTERFIDFILTAFIPRSIETKVKIYNLLNENLLEYLKIEKQIFIDNYLFGSINRDLNEIYVEDIEFRNSLNNGRGINECIFSNCDFYDIDLNIELLGCENLHFINCSFYNCKIDKNTIELIKLNFTNCSLDNAELVVDREYTPDEVNVTVLDSDIYQKKVLERFWQSGKDKFIPFKRPNTLRMGCPNEEMPYIDDAIEELVKKGFIIRRRGHHSLELNIQFINEIKSILGR